MDPLYLQPGTLRHIITIQKVSTTRDASGQPVSVWTTVLTTRAKQEGTTSNTYKELVQDGAIASQATDVFTIRWPGSSIALKPGMHILRGGNTYIVQTLDNVLGRNRVVKMICMSIDSDSN
jgi:head-tail adaptor